MAHRPHFGKMFPCGHEIRAQCGDHCLHKKHSIGFRRRGHLLDFLCVGCHRLLAQHMLPVIHAENRKVMMSAVGRADVDCVDVRIGCHLFDVRVNLAYSVRLCERLSFLLGARTDGRRLESWLHHRPFQYPVADTAGPDYSESCLSHFSIPLSSR